MGSEELRPDILRVRVVQIVEHPAELLRQIDGGNCAARPFAEACRKFAAAEIRRVVALSLCKPPAQNILKLSRVVAGGGLVCQVKMALDYIVNIPQDHRRALLDLLRGHGHAAADIIHFTDYVVERGSDKHIAYAASKAALDNMTRSFARKLAPEVKVNAIAPAMILFNESDDAEYRQQALNKSLMKIAPGEKEVIDLIDYLLTSCYVTGRTFAVDGGRPLR